MSSRGMIAIGACVVMLTVAACDAPWAGPSLPGGARWIDATAVSFEGPLGLGAAIAAGTSIEQVRQEVLTHPSVGAGGACNAYAGRPDPCWYELSESPGQIYVAALGLDAPCTAATKDAWAAGPSTVYLIHWVGNRSGTCNLALGAPGWRLYSVPRSELSGHGSLTVELLLQGNAHGSAEVQIQLE